MDRGTYLADALADCSGCHTPRNIIGAEEKSKGFVRSSAVSQAAAPAILRRRSFAKY